MTKVKSKLIAFLCAIVMVLGLTLTSLPVFAHAEGTEDSDVSNSASFSTDTIYQIVTDRFYDGDPSNNPSVINRDISWLSTNVTWSLISL